MKKIIAFLICFTLIFSFAACEKKPEEEKQGGSTQQQYGYKLIHGFNSYLELVNFRMSAVGDISVNTDSKYITEGGASMRWQAYDSDVDVDNNGQPKAVKKQIYIPTLTIEDNRFDDFSSIVNVRFDMYNASSTDVIVFTSLAKVGSSISTDTTLNHTLPSNEWTTVDHPVERAALDLFMDITDITHISLAVEGINTLIYVDNLRFEYTPIPYVPVQMELDPYEICSFDKPYQQSVFYYQGAEVSKFEELKVETNPLYTKGGGSLKIKSNNTYHGDGWPRVWFSTKYMQKVNIAQYSKDDFFYMDVYKAFDKPITFGFTLTFRNFQYGSFQNINIQLPAGIGWKEVKIPLADVTVNNPDMMSFSLQNTTFAGTTLYIDNLKIIKGE